MRAAVAAREPAEESAVFGAWRAGCGRARVVVGNSRHVVDSPPSLRPVANHHGRSPERPTHACRCSPYSTNRPTSRDISHVCYIRATTNGNRIFALNSTHPMLLHPAQRPTPTLTRTASPAMLTPSPRTQPSSPGPPATTPADLKTAHPPASCA